MSSRTLATLTPKPCYRRYPEPTHIAHGGVSCSKVRYRTRSIHPPAAPFIPAAPRDNRFAGSWHPSLAISALATAVISYGATSQPELFSKRQCSVQVQLSTSINGETIWTKVETIETHELHFELLEKILKKNS